MTSSTSDIFRLVLTVENDSWFTVLLTLRVAALYRTVRWAVWLIWLAFALFQGMRVAVLLFGEATLYSEVSSS